VHSGKYGIRPIWPSDQSLCEQWQHGRKSSKVIIIFCNYKRIIVFIWNLTDNSVELDESIQHLLLFMYLQWLFGILSTEIHLFMWKTSVEIQIYQI
jgi:hypothetical protein